MYSDSLSPNAHEMVKTFKLLTPILSIFASCRMKKKSTTVNLELYEMSEWTFWEFVFDILFLNTPSALSISLMKRGKLWESFKWS